MQKTATLTISFGFDYEQYAEMAEEWGEGCPTEEQFVEYCMETALEILGSSSDGELRANMSVTFDGFEEE